jgi:hypothetical protein
VIPFVSFKVVVVMGAMLIVLAFVPFKLLTWDDYSYFCDDKKKLSVGDEFMQLGRVGFHYIKYDCPTSQRNNPHNSTLLQKADGLSIPDTISE